MIFFNAFAAGFRYKSPEFRRESSMRLFLATVIMLLISACGPQVGTESVTITDADGALVDSESSAPQGPNRSPYHSDFNDPEDREESTDGNSDKITESEEAVSIVPLPPSVWADSDQVKKPVMEKRQNPRSTDVVFGGQMSPTIYYQAFLNEDGKTTCQHSQRVPLYGEKRKVLLRVCPQNLEICALQGSCQITQDGVTHSFNVIGSSRGIPVFFEISREDCVFGFGVRSICLDPFFTVAADLRHHKPGDVIFVPLIEGLLLPNGQRHDGYLVVRDRGGAIIGPHRFDFFTGNMDWRDPENPFTRLKLNDKRQRFPYYSVKGETARKVLAARTFPKLPRSWITSQ